MNDINYIDKIVKDSIGEMKAPVNFSWKQIQNTIQDTPKAHIPTSGNFLSSVFSKIVAAFSIAAGVVAAFFFIVKPNSEKAATQKPVDVTIEIVVGRQANVTVETDYTNDADLIVDNQQNPNLDLSNNQNNASDTANQIIIINVETTEIDTLHNN
ncbi:MAG: hypothetical protein JXR68_07470 [Bacteroidales bacterium]|nr:hypothetical protein [Bacteroidales bacterium]